MASKKPNVKREVVVNNIDMHQAYLTRKLKHYNEWLMDNDRDFAVPYPGFPEDKKPSKPKADKVITPSKPTKPKGKKSMSISTVGIKIASRPPKSGTKQSLAVEIVRRFDMAKSESVEAIMSELNMSKAGATTYFHNAKRLIENRV